MADLIPLRLRDIVGADNFHWMLDNVDFAALVVDVIGGTLSWDLNTALARSHGADAAAAIVRVLVEHKLTLDTIPFPIDDHVEEATDAR